MAAIPKLTAGQLLKLTPAKIRKRTSGMQPGTQKDQVQGGGKFRTCIGRVSLYNPESSGDSYVTAIKNYGTLENPREFSFQADSKIWVHCSCPYFLFHLEMALVLQKCSTQYDSNGDLPVITNPKLRPFLCKHLYAYLLFLIQRDKTAAS